MKEQQTPFSIVDHRSYPGSKSSVIFENLVKRERVLQVDIHARHMPSLTCISFHKMKKGLCLVKSDVRRPVTGWKGSQHV